MKHVLLESGKYLKDWRFFIVTAASTVTQRKLNIWLNLSGLRSRRLEVVGERENGRARGRHDRGEGVLARKAFENRFNSHSVSADISY